MTILNFKGESGKLDKLGKEKKKMENTLQSTTAIFSITMLAQNWEKWGKKPLALLQPVVT